MKPSKVLLAILLGAAALGMGTGGAFAVCNDGLAGYPVFQVPDLAYFDTAPFPIAFDANTFPTNIAARMFQIGFGNDLINTGAGTTGTGNDNLSTFAGNDGGIRTLNMTEVSQFDSRIPGNTVGLRSLNWEDAGVDGCCDNPRVSTQPVSDDNILNPYFNEYYYSFGYQGVYSLDWQQDYPMALFLKSQLNPSNPDDSRWFAVAAVATINRGNTGGNGPCDMVFGGGNNAAACDIYTGEYDFKDISNGNVNPTNGARNVVPWQEVPRPRASCTAGCSGAGTRTVDFSWPIAIWFDDGSHRPTTNPGMATADATRAAGVGMMDLRRKTTIDPNINLSHWKGLFHYTLQQANVSSLDPNGNVDFGALQFADVMTFDQPTSAITGAPNPPGGTCDTVNHVCTAGGVGRYCNANGDCGLITATGVSAPEDTCWRIRLTVGKLQEIAGTGIGQTTIANCRLGKCGDRGYFVESYDPASIVCVGGALVSEKAENLVATKSHGGIDVTWDTTSELSMTGFDVIAVTRNGKENKLGSLSCQNCTTGIGASYSFSAPQGSLKGGVTAVRVEVKGGNPSSLQVPLQ